MPQQPCWRWYWLRLNHRGVNDTTPLGKLHATGNLRHVVERVFRYEKCAHSALQVWHGPERKERVYLRDWISFALRADEFGGNGHVTLFRFSPVQSSRCMLYFSSLEPNKIFVTLSRHFRAVLRLSMHSPRFRIQWLFGTPQISAALERYWSGDSATPFWE